MSMDKHNHCYNDVYCKKVSRLSSGKSSSSSFKTSSNRATGNTLLNKQEKLKLSKQSQLKHLFNLSNNNNLLKHNNPQHSAPTLLSNKLVSKRKSEPFHRISATTLVHYLSVHNPVVSSTPENQSSNSSSISTYLAHTCIIFDLRSQAEYDMYHIRSARNYHCINIARDRFPEELLLNKNKASTFIVLYHLNEKNGIEYANHLYDKGYDNIYYLTGGVENFVKKYPEYSEGEYKEYLISLKREAKRIERENELLRQGKRESKYHPCYGCRIKLEQAGEDDNSRRKLSKSTSVDVIGLIPSEKNFILSLRQI